MDPRLSKIHPWTFFSIQLRPHYGHIRLATGSAFCVSLSNQHYLVTNLHNVTGRNLETGLCISASGAVPERLLASFLGVKQLPDQKCDYDLNNWVEKTFLLYDSNNDPVWFVHPTWNDVDIAVIPFSPAGGVFPALQLDNYAEPSDLFPGNQVHVIGYPWGFASYEKLPIWTTGALASSFHLPYRDRPRFLIDCTVRPGNSGSPVVTYTGHTSDVSAFGNNYQIPELCVLGVYSGRITPPQRSQDLNPFDSDTNNLQEVSLGQVWKLSLIKEIIENQTRGHVEFPPQKPT